MKKGGIIRSVVAPHTPRMGIEEKAPDFVKEVIRGSLQMGEDIRADKPDVIIINSTHYVCTFNWYATTVKEHKGYCVAMEAPDLIDSQYYHYKGDPEMGQAIVDELRAFGYPANPNASETYAWDYGSWVPARYLDPKAEIPIVLVGCTLAADIEESFNAGVAIRRAAEKTGRRAVFVSSSSFTHKLVRGPHIWPSKERMDADFKFIDLLLAGKIAEAKKWFPEYAEFVVGEMGGRTLATMLGCLDEKSGEKYIGRQFGPYGQSSGSGNANVSVKIAA